jgi:hypothetical protein
VSSSCGDDFPSPVRSQSIHAQALKGQPLTARVEVGSPLSDRLSDGLFVDSLVSSRAEERVKSFGVCLADPKLEPTPIICLGNAFTEFLQNGRNRFMLFISLGTIYLYNVYNPPPSPRSRKRIPLSTSTALTPVDQVWLAATSE